MKDTYSRPNQLSLGSKAILVLTGICLLPFLRLAFFAHAYLDDFIFPIMVRQQGVWEHTMHMYNVWQGRFSASLITALHPLAWGDLHAVKPFAFGFILLFTSVVFFASNSLLEGSTVPISKRLAAGGLVLSISLVMLPNPVEAFFLAPFRLVLYGWLRVLLTAARCGR
ncbi:hypothetical protein MUN82_06555 [Hymenobacter aerilatus]|uniref:Uncharacterized protein n=1 Tax=Hymenobacter aerilatus TaxID=2932251 RepID=A0A8T9T3R9_9BACT|nr:hypothetical protein [Hymenobacter aerilatus]UOR06756.1 hypothetical protein MUN82_06555 [Hymenobacter aerilatus]